MDYPGLMPQGSHRKGIPVKVVIFTLMSMVFICKVDFGGCLNTNKVEALCNAESCGDVEWGDHLEKLVNDLIDLAPVLHFSAYARYPLWYDASTWYGCAACNGHLSQDDCSSCLKTISDVYAKNTCRGRAGMTIKLEDCRMRCEVYPFDVEVC
ncbi:hypothetical protein MLD38_018341 [Melastoma candidum]|uniref:Uncharacterized protein n=1 Tax=Melastoma candidum TaxID=119954 RepID=A0ACB9QU22_9MYRT|nr:hypothetical protein MLD38_018341 [Melastoma candidum]